MTTTSSEPPWLQRSIWRDGQIKNITSKSLISISVIFSIFALFSAVLIVGLLAAFFSDNSEMTFKSGLFNILFQLAIIALLIFLFMQVKIARDRWQRWRECVFSLQTMPAFIGGTLKGMLIIPSGLKNGSIIRCSLGCYRDRRRSNGRIMFNKGIPLWESGALKTPVNTELKSIPVLFELPKNRPESNWLDPHDRVNWILTVRAGGDDNIEYEVPVFINPDEQLS